MQDPPARADPPIDLPDAEDLDDRLRAEVRRLKTLSSRRRRLPTLLHVGTLGGARLVVPVAADADAEPGDPGLPGDLLTRALDRMSEADEGNRQVGDQQVWLTRAGRPVPGDVDWRWRTGTTVARSRYGAAPGAFHVVTRTGWLELPSGRRRTWRRMRATWQAPYADDRDDLERPDPIEGWPVRF